ncbi:hypothetical protein SLEP1_g27748 [Rubroshorea leprosula]|uniref:Uncharacterized protein n=1 Tax=Rubroshorea leprosula TaxID=152421 RepID=A0AAV5JRC5_9ROSI|nr:hypothetical protein SLEP1_g27748 [Rubroshorea leprosula]
MWVEGVGFEFPCAHKFVDAIFLKLVVSPHHLFALLHLRQLLEPGDKTRWTLAREVQIFG